VITSQAQRKTIAAVKTGHIFAIQRRNPDEKRRNNASAIATPMTSMKRSR
jgi:hypothetical protein